jgi:hypothetical protein
MGCRALGGTKNETKTNRKMEAHCLASWSRNLPAPGGSTRPAPARTGWRFQDTGGNGDFCNSARRDRSGSLHAPLVISRAAASAIGFRRLSSGVGVESTAAGRSRRRSTQKSFSQHQHDGYRWVGQFKQRLWVWSPAKRVQRERSWLWSCNIECWVATDSGGVWKA